MPSEAGRVIVDILVVLVAAKIGGELAERLGQPAVLGELVLGVVVGPSVLGLMHESDVMAALAQLGAILLLFEVGLETDLTEVLRVGVMSLRVASLGVIAPFAAGAGVASMLGYPTLAAIFLGATMTATSVGITARVLSDMKRLDTDEGRIILGAAVVDDVIGLVILAVVSSLVGGASLSAASLGRIIGFAVGFLVFALLIGLRISPPLFRWISVHLRVRGVLITAAFAFCLVLAFAAEKLGLAPIVGAFAAGVVLAKTDDHQVIRQRLTPLADVFIPIFFLSMGVLVDVREMLRPGVLTLVGVLGVVAIAGKVVSGAGAPASMSRIAIGVGMVPRGEVGLIFASFGLSRGIIRPDTYAGLLAVVVLTTFVTPPICKPLFAKLGAARGGVPGKIFVPRRPLDASLVLGPRW